MKKKKSPLINYVGYFVALLFLVIELWENAPQQTSHNKNLNDNALSGPSKTQQTQRSPASTNSNNEQNEQHSRSPAQSSALPPQLEELIEKYQAHDQLQYNDTNYSLSSTYQAVAEKDFSSSQHGALLENLYSYAIFKPNGDQSESAIVISHLTHQVGIVTGRLIVQIDINNNRDKLIELSQQEGFRIGELRPYVNHQEIHIKPASRSFELSKVLQKAGFTLAEVEIIDHGYELR